jgi:hypothetical protein
LTGSILIIVTAEGLAQPSEQDATIRELRNQLEEMRSQMVTMQNRIATLEAAKGIAEVRSQPDETKTAAEPTAFRFKGLTLTPGGFLNSTALVRARNENADLATSYSAIPLDGSSNANLSELRGTARTSQLSLLIQGSAGNTTLRGYVETDFLGAAPTANYVQASSWTPRLKQVWTQIERPSGLTITAGQMWSLLTTNRQGMANLQELRPGGEEANFVVGFTWTRERAVRVTQNFNNRVWVGVALENPESTYSAAFVPPNVMGLNTSPNAATGVNLLPFLANYSNGQSTTLAPDLVAKLPMNRAGDISKSKPGPLVPRSNRRDRNHEWPYTHDRRLWCWLRCADAVCGQTPGGIAGRAGGPGYWPLWHCWIPGRHVGSENRGDASAAPGSADGRAGLSPRQPS